VASTPRQQFDETSARIEARTGRNLFLAIGSGVLFGGIFVASLFFFKEIFVVLVAAIVAITVLELATAFRQNSRRIPRVGGILFALLIIAGAYWFGAAGMFVALLISLFGLTLWRLIEGLIPGNEVPPKTLLRDVMAGVFTLVYVAFFSGFTVLLVLQPNGQWWVFTLVAVVVSVDVGAFAAGVSFGKHKMVPKISPNKTWEGFAGAAVMSIVVATLLAIFPLGQPWWIGVLMGVLLLLTATGGDLTESLIKRNLGVKDMSSWIPGHGGFLDRLDSIFPSTVVAYGLYIAVSMPA
jgi:phosphatidate cytidylyltransferase